MSAGGEVSKEWSPKIAAQGAVVIDNSSAWRYDSDVPLVVPEVNAEAVRDMKKGIIANPNCSTAQLVVALKPLHDHATIKRVVVATYQSVSGAGKDGMDELDRQTKALYSLQDVQGEEVSQAHRLQRDPPYRRVHGGRLHEGRVEDDGRDEEDPRSRRSSSPQPACACRSSSAIRKPSTSSSRSRSRPTRRATILRSAPGIIVIDKREPGGYITPHEAAGEDATYISRIREDITVENGLSFWCVSDNLRKGAALNAVQIAEAMVNRGLLKAKRQAA